MSYNEHPGDSRFLGATPGGPLAPPTTCHDCARPYGDEHEFPDLIVPDRVWAAISPSGDEVELAPLALSV